MAELIEQRPHRGGSQYTPSGGFRATLFYGHPYNFL